MKASILAIGSELLTPQRVDTNALFLTRRLLELGIEVVLRQTVADDLSLLSAAFRHALERSELVIATGGLGPTEDDLTREAAAAALGRGMTRDGAYLAALKERFARYGRAMAPVNEKQADRIDGAELLHTSAAREGRRRAWGQAAAAAAGPTVEMEPCSGRGAAAAPLRAGGGPA